jgi:hypothetical protein
LKKDHEYILEQEKKAIQQKLVKEISDKEETIFVKKEKSEQ